jgi:hypothetical protein
LSTVTQAFVNCSQSLADGGRVAIGAWAESERVELLTPLVRALESVSAVPTLTALPLLFSMSNEARLVAELAGAGFDEITVHSCEQTFTFPDAHALWRVLETALPASMERIAKLPAEVRSAVMIAFVEELYPYFGDGPVILGPLARFAIGRAKKSGSAISGGTSLQMCE